MSGEIAAAAAKAEGAAAAEGVGDSTAGSSFKSGLSTAGKGTAAGAAAGIYDLIKGFGDLKDYCLNGTDTAKNIGINFFSSFGDALTGGAFSTFKGMLGIQSPEEKLKKKLNQLNAEYQSVLNKFTLRFMANTVSIEEDLFSAVQDVGQQDRVTSLFYYDLNAENAKISGIYTMFLYIYFIILFIYILIFMK